MPEHQCQRHSIRAMKSDSRIMRGLQRLRGWLPLASPLGLCLVLAGASAPLLGAESSDVFPSRPVTVVLAIAPGGPVDAEARLYLPKMQGVLGQPFVVDFKPGATGTTGTAYVARAVPDGYTLLLVTSGLTVFPAVYKSLAFDPIKDFAHLSLMSKKPTVLVANPSFPPRDAAEYLAYARANPGKVNFGTTGNGSSNHLVGAWIHSATRTKVTFVPYKGLGPMLPDIMGGRLDLTSAILSGVMPLIKSGKLRALAMTGEKRSGLLPDVPTISEKGIPGYDYSYWTGFSAPAGTPPAIAKKLADAFARVAHLPDVVTALESDGALAIGSSPEQFRQLLIAETTLWRKVVQDSGIAMED